MTHEAPKIGDDVLSPVTDEQKATLLGNTQKLYEESAMSESYYAPSEGEEPHQVERSEIPTPNKWLHELSGKRHIHYGWTEYSIVVFVMARDVVWEAYRRRFGDDWQDDEDIEGAALDAEYELYSWVTSKLKDVSEKPALKQMPAAIIKATGASSSRQGEEAMVGHEDTFPHAVEFGTDTSYGELEGPFLSDEEEAILPGEGGICADLPFADITCGASGVMGGERVYIFIVEFHYRNDATRHIWGDPDTVEEDITTTMEEQERAIKLAFTAALSKLDEIGGAASMQLHEYMQPSGESTDDRHVLYLFVPIAYVLENFKNSDELVAWLRRLIK